MMLCEDCVRMTVMDEMTGMTECQIIKLDSYDRNTYSFGTTKYETLTQRNSFYECGLSISLKTFVRLSAPIAYYFSNGNIWYKMKVHSTTLHNVVNRTSVQIIVDSLPNQMRGRDHPLECGRSVALNLSASSTPQFNAWKSRTWTNTMVGPPERLRFPRVMIME